MGIQMKMPPRPATVIRSGADGSMIKSLDWGTLLVDGEFHVCVSYMKILKLLLMALN